MATALTRSGPFDSASYTEANWREWFTAAIGHGVITGIGQEASVSPGSGRQVLIGSLWTWIAGEFGALDAQAPLNLATQTLSGTRNDLVVLRNNFTANQIEFDVVQGTVGGGIPTPTVNASMREIPLASLALVQNYANVTSGNITDLRGFLSPYSVPTFANTTARGLYITSPAEGMFSYLRDTNALYVYNGSSWGLVNLTGVPFVSAANGTSQSFTVGAATNIRYANVVEDAYSAYNSATGVFTAPFAGVYHVDFSLSLDDQFGPYCSASLVWASSNAELWRARPSSLGAGLGGINLKMSMSHTVRVAAGAQIVPRFKIEDTSGGDPVAGSVGNTLTITWLGP